MKKPVFFKSAYLGSIFLLISTLALASNKDSLEWNKIVKEQYMLHYTISDKEKINGIDKNIQSGIRFITNFFKQSFFKKFDVYIFPDRASLDKQWQKEWGDSAFQSQCWMIASGVAHRLDILSPNAWLKEACEHNANDSTEVKQVIWHELVHVFHGQHNPDHTFSYIEKLDWFVEGVATFVSGQMDEKRLQRIRLLAKENKTPTTLDDFWKGQEKYGLSGSVVAYIDKTYGREKLFALLKFTNKQEALKFLGIPEEKLIKNWKDSLVQ